MHQCHWLPLLFVLVLGCAGCGLGTKLACNADGDCFDGLTCVSGACYKCAADKAGCACAEGSCLHGMVCGAETTCVDCSETDPCVNGLACDAGRCVACNSDFAGCPCDDGQCGAGLRCSEINECEVLACSDGSRNGDETDVDCGGSCSPCTEGSSCLAATDCESLACDQGECLAIGSCLVRTDEFPTIQSAVDDVRCATILLDEGLFDEHVRIERPVEILGVPPEEVSADGTMLSSGVPVSTIEIVEGAGVVHLRHLEFRDGSASRGGAVHARSHLVVEDSLFVRNRATVDAVSNEEQLHPCGGAIFIEDADLTVRGSVFVQNEAEETRFTGLSVDTKASGGAICVLGDSTTLVETSEFRSNVATTTADVPAGFTPPDTPNSSSHSAGGAIYRYGGAIAVRESAFDHNEARTSIVAREGEYRSAQSAGGAIFVGGQPHGSPPVVIERSRFLENVAHSQGAGVGAYFARAEGGALKVSGGESRIAQTTFDHNWALAEHPDPRALLSFGGGASLSSSRLESTRFFRNRVEGEHGSGGALYHLGGACAIINSVFWDNRGVHTSGIHMQSRGSLFSSTVVNNGPGPQLAGPFSEEDLVIRHSVVSGGHGACDHRRLVSGGANVFEVGDCLVPLAVESDRVVGAARLETGYGRYSGLRTPPRQAFSTLPGFPLGDSPVKDAGDPDGCRDEAGNPILVDNRGEEREEPCDVGAFALGPGESTNIPLRAFLLRRVTPRAPQFFAPGDGSCVDNVTEELAEFINQSIAGDNDRPPDQECDGLIDAPLVLILETANSDFGRSLLKPAQCVEGHIACGDPWVPPCNDISSPSCTWPGAVDFQLRAEEPCTFESGGGVVEPGANGCIQANITDLLLDVGLPFVFSDAELTGQFDVLPDRIVNGTLRGLLSTYNAQGITIPSVLRPALGGATVLSDLLCGVELEQVDGRVGYFVEVELHVEFEAVTLYGEGLPPTRQTGCR